MKPKPESRLCIELRDKHLQPFHLYPYLNYNPNSRERAKIDLGNSKAQFCFSWVKGHIFTQLFLQDERARKWDFYGNRLIKSLMSASREKRDVYYRLAKQTGLRARSAFKLLQLNRTCQFLDGSNVLDLCAAPGGWSALCQQILQNNKQLDNTTSQTDVNETHPEDAFISPPKVIAVDCVTIDPIPGVSIILGDISRPSTARDILKETNGKQMDVVLFDGAPDVIGQLDFDETIQHSLILSGAILCLSVLRNGGQYVAKIFRGAQTSKTCSILACLFDEVYMAKPQASRNSSLEGFVICQGFNPHESLRALPLQVILSLGLEQAIRLTNDPPKDADHRFGNGPGKRAGPEFIPCPDIYDADKSYSLGEDLQYNFN